MNIEFYLINFGYLFIFLYMISNGIFSFPSSQLLYILSGYLVFKGYFNFFVVLLLGAIGNTIGNYILYTIAKKRGLKYSIKLVSLFFSEDIKNKIFREIKKVEIAFKKKGVIFLFVGKLLNPIKIIIPIPAGISKMRVEIFLIVVFLTSFIWASIFVSLGYFFGKSYEKFSYIGIIMLSIATLVLFIFYKFINTDIILKEIENEDKRNI